MTRSVLGLGALWLALGSGLMAEPMAPGRATLNADGDDPKVERAAADGEAGKPVVDPPTAPVNIDSPSPIETLIQPRFSARYIAGPGVGYPNGFVSVEGFMPLMQTPGRSLAFANGRVFNFLDGRYWELQIGGGYRWLLSDPGLILGLNGFYDARKTDVRWYNQAGIGWEVLSRCWEVRGNVYLPFGNDRAPFRNATTFANPFFTGTNIALNTTSVQQFEAAMRGCDVEVGHALPGLCDNLRTMAYLGYYHYGRSGFQSVDGIRGRLESWVGENLSMQFAMQNDAVFNTTVTGGLGVHWGGVRPGYRQENPLAAKLGDRVVRDPNIMLQNKTTTVQGVELAVDPATGKPIEVRHVRSNAGPGGNGSVEQPFNNLNELQAGSTPGAILFAHAGSFFHNQGISLQAGQRFLGESIPHHFTATQGRFLLPRATSGTTLPVIFGAPGPAIVVASNTEVSGFQIAEGRAAGIVGANIANVNLNRNAIRFSFEDAIRLTDITGQSTISGNYIREVGFSEVPSSGIKVVLNNGGQGSYQIADNDIQTVFGDAGILVQSSNSSTAWATINRNRVDDVFNFLWGSGVLVRTQDTAKGFFQVANNTATNTIGFEILAESMNQSALGLQLANNTVVANVILRQFNNSLFQVEDVLGTNSVVPIQLGTINLVPQGTFGYPAP